MKILILVNNELTIYNFRQEFITLLRSENHEVYIAMPKGKYKSLFESFGCTVIEYGLSQRGMNPFKDFLLPMKYLKIINRVQPDIVLTYTIKPNIYGGMACSLKNIPYIATVTGLGSAFEKGPLVKSLSLMLYKVGLKKVSCVFFQNTSHEQLFREHDIARGRCAIVPGSGVNLTKHCFEDYPSESNGIRLLFVGRVTKDKGVDELLEAYSRLCKNCPSYKIHLGLLGNVENEYNGVLEMLENDGSCSFYGRQENVHDYIKNAHVVILPSYHEGMANVLLEAAACGRPVIASLIPGCQETFDQGETGIGCLPKSADSLYQALYAFISMDHSQRAEMGIKGRQKIEREFDRKMVNETYLSVIREIAIV